MSQQRPTTHNASLARLAPAFCAMTAAVTHLRMQLVVPQVLVLSWSGRCGIGDDSFVIDWVGLNAEAPEDGASAWLWSFCLVLLGSGSMYCDCGDCLVLPCVWVMERHIRRSLCASSFGY